MDPWFWAAAALLYGGALILLVNDVRQSRKLLNRCEGGECVEITNGAGDVVTAVLCERHQIGRVNS